MGVKKAIRFSFFITTVICAIPMMAIAGVVLGDISFDNAIGLEEAISALNVSAGGSDPNIMNVSSMQSAYGTYMFNDSTNEFSAYLTHTNIPRNVGPPIGVVWTETVSFPDSDTMNYANFVWSRKKTGSGSVMTGVWEAPGTNNDLYRMFVSSSDDALFIVRYANQYNTPLNKKTISINGDFSDWSIDDRVYMDTDGPECGNAPGLDLLEVYMVQDDEYLYVRYVLNGSPDVDFGYKFGTSLLHTYASREEGTGDAYIGWATSVGMGMGLPDEDVDISGSEMEFRVDLCLPGWTRVSLDAWLDDHNFVTGETTCSDYVQLPDYYIDTSVCP